MKTFKEFNNGAESSDNDISSMNEGILSGFAFERKLKSLASEISSTRDLDKKLDILGKMLHLSAGANLLQVHKRRKS